MNSRMPGFYRLSPEHRLDALVEAGAIELHVAHAYLNGGLSVEGAGHMVENVIGTYSLPNAVAVNLLVNHEDRVVPMVVEEPSVVAAVSNMARLTRASGGVMAESDPSEMIGQIQLADVPDAAHTGQLLRAHLAELQELASAVHPRLTERGGGIRDLEVRELLYDEPGFPREEMVVLHFVLDCVDAMGANMINTVAERLAPRMEAITGQRVSLRILSNLADRRCSRARVRIDPAHLDTDDQDGRDVAARIASAWRFAWADPYRAATHNKGVMNGIDAVAVATGNDWRAIEAGAHAFAARSGTYCPLTTWRIADDGFLVGEIEVPLQFGTVGGLIRNHPTAQANLQLLGDRGARDLSSIAAAVGLVQNLGALRALASEGIQAGHMRMHARSVAAGAGARPDEVSAVVEHLVSEKDFSPECALRVLTTLRG